MATTRALAQEAEPQAALATANQQAKPEEQPQQECPINEELRQEGQAESMTQASTTLRSQMLWDVIYRNSMHIALFASAYQPFQTVFSSHTKISCFQFMSRLISQLAR